MAETREETGREDRGAAPFVGERPTIELEGVTYALERLGWDECWSLAATVGVVLRQGGIDSAGVGVYAPEGSIGMAAIGALLAAAAARSDQLLHFAASNLRRILPNGTEQKMDPGELRDAKQWPAYGVVRWVRALCKHPDLTLFFDELRQAGPDLAALAKTFSSAPSIVSPRPDGEMLS